MIPCDRATSFVFSARATADMTRIGATYLDGHGFGRYLRAGQDFIAAVLWVSDFEAHDAKVFLRVNSNVANRAGVPMALCYASVCDPVSWDARDAPRVFLYHKDARHCSTPWLCAPFRAPLDAEPRWRKIDGFARSAPRLYADIMDVACELRPYLPHPPPHPYPPPSVIDIPEDPGVH